MPAPDRAQLPGEESREVRGRGDCPPIRSGGNRRPPTDGEAWEYSILLTIKDDRGQAMARQVLGVGAVKPDEERTFELSVEVLTPKPAAEVTPA